ncbi:MAG TPA: hypothetical protein VHI53_06415 [Gaiellaceae bacterium]|jgi:hypothetical protein|nr:hypothetical protein [Gaiellaceae bacterium]
MHDLVGTARAKTPGSWAFAVAGLLTALVADCSGGSTTSGSEKTQILESVASDCSSDVTQAMLHWISVDT